MACSLFRYAVFGSVRYSTATPGGYPLCNADASVPGGPSLYIIEEGAAWLRPLLVPAVSISYRPSSPSPPMRRVISSMRSSGNGGLAQGLQRNRHELHGIVVRRRSVGAEGAAAAAPVDDGSLAAPAHPDGDRLHDPAAVRLPVAGLDVDMQTCKAVRAVVAVAAPRVIRGAEPAADLTGKASLQAWFL